MLVTLGLWEISRTEEPESIQITTENPSAASVIENLNTPRDRTEEQDSISGGEWLEDQSIVEGSRRNRRMMVLLLLKHNGRKVGSMSNVGHRLDRLVEDVRQGRLSAYRVSRTLVDQILKTHAVLTVYSYRSMLPGLWESTLGEGGFSRKTFDRLVPCPTPYITVVKKIPEPDGVKAMLRMSNPQYKAVVGGLAITGMRIMEWLTRKWSDVEVRQDGHAIVHLQSAETKARYPRHAFLTREVVEWVGLYHRWLGAKPEILFPGVKSLEAPLEYGTVREQVKALFDKNGMKDDEAGRFTIHGFRTYADGQMRACGLDSKYVSAIIGHKNKLQGETHYLDWREIEEQWVAKCSHAMTFFPPKPDDYQKVKDENQKVKEENEDLKILMRKLLARL